MHKLPTKFKEPWLTALRSGKYKQGKGFLRSKEGRYCCLGVAHEVWGGQWRDDMRDTLAYRTQFGGMGSLPTWEDYPVEARDAMTQMSPMGAAGSVAMTLATMNDKNCTFEHIADWIEKNL